MSQACASARLTPSSSPPPLLPHALSLKTFNTHLRRGLRAVCAVGLIATLAACASAPAPAPVEESATNASSAGAQALPSVAAAGEATTAPSDRSQVPLKEIASAETHVLGVASLTAPADIWERIRRGLAMPDLNNDLVRDREQWYLSRPDYIGRMTDRSSRYLFHIVEEIERRNLPMELALLPFIESAFNPEAVSGARAAGMWQFMPATGASFDLKQNMFRDDRRDVVASTRAALDYLEQLHARFGDWHLALAAYNWGQGNVGRAITRNQSAGLATDYQALSMPAETRLYVPKLQAVENIIAQAERYGTALPDIGNHPFFDTLALERDMDVALIARLANISEQDFRALNPSIKQPIVMAAGTPQILLPWDNANLFEERVKSHNGPLASWTTWTVPDTLTVAQAATRAGMSESDLRLANNIPPRMLVRAGSSLLVHRSGQRNQDVPVNVADNGHLSLQAETILRRSSVRARKGDTLASLASRYGVTMASLASWNHISTTSRLKAGQRIQLLLPKKTRSATAAPAPAAKTAKSAGAPGRHVAAKESVSKSAARSANATTKANANKRVVKPVSSAKASKKKKR